MSWLCYFQIRAQLIFSADPTTALIQIFAAQYIYLNCAEILWNSRRTVLLRLGGLDWYLFIPVLIYFDTEPSYLTPNQHGCESFGVAISRVLVIHIYVGIYVIMMSGFISIRIL